MAQIKPEAHADFGTTCCDARELVEWMPHDPRFDALRRDVLELLRAPRKGQLFLQLGPEQLCGGLASDRKRADELLGKVRRISLALPKTLRPLIWTLLLNPKANVELPAGASLPRPLFEELKRLVETSLYSNGLGDDRKARQRRQQSIDPSGQALLVADEWRGAPPFVGMPAAIDATAMVWDQRLIAGPSQAGHPVTYTVASVSTAGKVALEPVAVPPRTFVPFPPKRFGFSKSV
jgi:hypothetical protein